MDKSDRIALWVIDGLLWLALVLMCIALRAIGNIYYNQHELNRAILALLFALLVVMVLALAGAIMIVGDCYELWCQRKAKRPTQKVEPPKPKPGPPPVPPRPTPPPPPKPRPEPPKPPSSDPTPSPTRPGPDFDPDPHSGGAALPVPTPPIHRMADAAA